jgi:ABC-type Fe3+ transport system substrate-binding protein
MMMGEDKFRDWTKCLGVNKPILQEGHITRMELMLAGDHAIQGDNFLYDGMTKYNENKSLPFAIVWTAPILARAGVVAISKEARHPYAAALYADWLLTEESQKFVYDGNRGPLAMRHPFIPDSAPLFTYGEIPDGAYQKIADDWRSNVANAK